MKKIIVAIDPDLNASGFSVYDVCLNNLILCKSEKLWDLFNELIKINKENYLTVFIESSTKSAIWHGKQNNTTSINVGKNKAIAKLIIDFMIDKHIKFKTFEPSGYSKYFDNVDFFLLQTKYDKRTNKDARASASIIYKNLHLLQF